MIRTYLIPLLAVAGLIFAVVTVVKGSRPPAAQPPVIEPPTAPFAAFVAGSGLIEPSSQNVAIGSPVGALVARVAVGVGADVKQGDVLFELDAREVRSTLESRRAALGTAEKSLARLRAGTRAELLPPARAKVAEAQADLADMQSQLERWKQVSDPRAVSADDLSRKTFAVETARARLESARAQLALLEAGTWTPDIEVAGAQVEEARAQVAAAETELDRRVVRAPMDGRVLQVNVRAGEFASAGPLATPLMLLGTVTPMHVRVDVDENEAWRARAGAKAVAYARGNKDISTPLEFVRFEPYVVPKKSLTGDSTERVDTRVLQVIYRFDPAGLPVYVGQQVDVFIEADAAKAATPAPTVGKERPQ